MSLLDQTERQGFFGPLKPRVTGVLRREFVAPPFTVLDAKQGDWQARKRRWIGLGIRSELGRGENLMRYGGGAALNNEKDTSLFDPVLCELIYRWWCPVGGRVLDPFAGGSVRGIVAGALDLRYTGIDLREEQVKENEQQAEQIEGLTKPIWIAGDSLHVVRKFDKGLPKADFVISCPPYGNLEQYSDDPRDLSTMDYDAFLEKYSDIIHATAKRLRKNRFACFVTSAFRDKEGFIHNLPGDTVRAFEAAGMRFYNDAILGTAITSASMRARRIFSGGRKLTKIHQNVQVFVKGDPRLASAAIAESRERTNSDL